MQTSILNFMLLDCFKPSMSYRFIIIIVVNGEKVYVYTHAHIHTHKHATFSSFTEKR